MAGQAAWASWVLVFGFPREVREGGREGGKEGWPCF